LERVALAVAADAVEGHHDDGVVVERRVGMSRNDTLVALGPQQGERIAIELPAVGRAQARAGQPEGGLAAPVAVEDEGVRQKRLGVDRRDLAALGGGPLAAQPVPVLEQRDRSLLFHVSTAPLFIAGVSSANRSVVL